MNQIFLDYETRSTADLPVCGLDNYVRSPDTCVLLCAYAFDDRPVELWQPHLGAMPVLLRDALDNPFVQKVAWNARFEHHISRACLGIDIPYAEFLDVMIWSRHLSVPFGLAESCPIYGIPTEQTKLKEGADLIKLFSLPADPGGEETLFGVSEPSFHDWNSRPKEWKRFCEYCVRDVEAERAILRKIEAFPLPALQQRGWVLDQQINDRGVPVDTTLVAGATAVAETAKVRKKQEFKTLTGLDNPNSRDQLLGWLRERGYSFSGLAKGFVERALAGEGGASDEAKAALLLRKQTAKNSTAKLDRIHEIVSPDARLRDQFSYLGSSRAGRWSSRGGVQLQNLPRPGKDVEKNLERAIELLRAGDHDAVAQEFANPLDVVAGCLRSMFRAPAGYEFQICDLNAIENRVLGWMAHCDAILRVFREGRCPYLDFSMRLFAAAQAEAGIHTYEELDALYKSGDAQAKKWRQDSKPSILGAGYRLGGGEEVETDDGDLVRTGLWGYALAMGVELTRQQSHDSIRVFRETFPEVRDLWYELEDAVFRAIRENGVVECARTRIQAFGPKKERKLLRILLPSGRGLHYIRPKIEDVLFMDKPKKTMTYEGIDLKTHTWRRIPTQGGRLLENADQAISRDLLLHGMFEAEKAGYTVVAHCHDELIALVPAGSPLRLGDLRECMIRTPEWATDLPLDADGFTDQMYRKG